MIVFLIVDAISAAGYTLGQCQPVKKLWDDQTPGHCEDLSSYIKFAGAHGGQLPSLKVILAD